MLAINFRQIGGPRTLACPWASEEMKCPMMKMPMPTIKKATVGKAKT